jgi:hypothetical protein
MNDHRCDYFRNLKIIIIIIIINWYHHKGLWTSYVYKIIHIKHVKMHQIPIVKLRNKSDDNCKWVVRD